MLYFNNFVTMIVIRSHTNVQLNTQQNFQSNLEPILYGLYVHDELCYPLPASVLNMVDVFMIFHTSETYKSY